MKKYEGLILILALVFLLRLPSWYEPYWYGDEGIYLVLGQGLRQGLVWYRDLHDNKPPLLYLLAAIAGNVFYFRLILTIWFGATVVLFFKLMQWLLPKSPRAWYIATLALVGLTTVFEGNIANAEIFMALPIIAGMLLLLSGRRYLLAGLMFSLAFLLKVPAAFDFAAAILWLAALPAIALATAGFTLPILATLIYYSIVGGFEPYLRSALLQNVGYLSSWGGSNQGLLLRAAGLTIGLIVFWILAAKWRLEAKFKLIVAWFLLALFGALLSARPYPHYLIQPAIPAAILLGWWWSASWRIKKILVALGFVAVASYLAVGFWQYPVLDYYQNFLSYAFGQRERLAYWRYFDERVPQTYALADYLKQTTLSSDRVFIWGDEPMVYALARRLPPGRYTVAYHIVDFDGYQETLNALELNPPKVVIIPTYEERPFPGLKEKITKDYVYVTQIDQALIYRKLNGDSTKTN